LGGEDVEHAKAIRIEKATDKPGTAFEAGPVPGPLSLVCLMALSSSTMIGLSRSEVVKEL
jgi:hypothetical protein